MSSLTGGVRISGNDLKNIGKLLGRKVNEILWIFGCSYTQWTDITKRETEDIRVSQTLLARLLLNHPELHPIPMPPSPDEVFRAIREVDESFPKRTFAVMLGLQPGSSHRLLDRTKEARVTSVVNNLLIILKGALDRAATLKEKREVLKLFRSMAEEEAQSRGIHLKELWEGEGWVQRGGDDDE